MESLKLILILLSGFSIIFTSCKNKDDPKPINTTIPVFVAPVVHCSPDFDPAFLYGQYTTSNAKRYNTDGTVIIAPWDSTYYKLTPTIFYEVNYKNKNQVAGGNNAYSIKTYTCSEIQLKNIETYIYYTVIDSLHIKLVEVPIHETSWRYTETVITKISSSYY